MAIFEDCRLPAQAGHSPVWRAIKHEVDRGANVGTAIMAVKQQRWRLGTLTLLLGGLISCGQLATIGANVNVTNIRDLQQNRTAYSTVYLKGRVENQAPFLGTGAYEVRDATGSIWVITTKALPNKGDEVLIKGEVQYKSIPVGGQDLGEVYVTEVEQLQRTPTRQ